jgi:RNA polymerase sigma-70 factor (ECF subfamily)
VYRQMRALAGPSQDLDDLVQAALEQTYRGLPSFEGRAQLSTWTHQICYRTWLRHRRWYGRWLRRFALTVSGEVPEMAAALHLVPAEAFEQRERVQRLHAALETVSPKRRAVVTLHDLQGLSLHEVAEVVDAGVLTVKSRLRDGRKMLARALALDPYFGDLACSEESEP